MNTHSIGVEIVNRLHGVSAVTTCGWDALGRVLVCRRREFQKPVDVREALNGWEGDNEGELG